MTSLPPAQCSRDLVSQERDRWHRDRCHECHGHGYNGNIVITEANGLSGLNLSAANGSVTLTVTTGSVSDLDNATDITAKSTTVTVSNGSFGTNANAIATSVDELTVSTAAQNGDIYVTEANGCRTCRYRQAKAA